jgi:hypothetical protein
MLDPLSSPETYQAFIYALPERYPSIRLSTLVYIPYITHHRIPAPDLSFTRPNLPFLVEEIERQVLKQSDESV